MLAVGSWWRGTGSGGGGGNGDEGQI